MSICSIENFENNMNFVKDYFEPKLPSYQTRLKVLEKLALKYNIQTYAFLAPLFPHMFIKH